MGESASLVLVVPHPFRDGLDGCEPFRGCTSSALWCGAAAGGGRLLDIATTDHCIAGSRLHAQKGDRRRLERHTTWRVIASRSAIEEHLSYRRTTSVQEQRPCCRLLGSQRASAK